MTRTHRVEAACLAVLLWLACQPTQEQAVRVASARFMPLDSLLAISRAAEYVPMLGDSQRLMLGTYPTGRYGPRVQLAPYRYAHAHDREEFARGNHLLGRLVNFDTIPYPKLNLGPLDTVYVWTNQMSVVLPDEGTAMYVSTRNGVGLERRLTFHQGPGFRATQPAGRFKWDDADEATCIWCDWAYWCVIQ